MVARVKKNDKVKVISGRDKGKVGLVVDILPKKNLVLVKDVAVVTKHQKARKQGQVSGIVKKEAYIPLCKVMPVCPQTNKPCRIRTKKTQEGKAIRVSHHSDQSF